MAERRLWVDADLQQLGAEMRELSERVGALKMQLDAVKTEAVHIVIGIEPLWAKLEAIVEDAIVADNPRVIEAMKNSKLVLTTIRQQMLELTNSLTKH